MKFLDGKEQVIDIQLTSYGKYLSFLEASFAHIFIVFTTMVFFTTLSMVAFGEAAKRYTKSHKK
jgi:hypothetical protein